MTDEIVSRVNISGETNGIDVYLKICHILKSSLLILKEIFLGLFE